MLNTKKLLYILPDLAYIAELLPAKKEHTFSIQSFRQINGEFLDDNEFIANNIEKLFTRIDKDEFHLILPDFLFTNTILNVKETTPEAVKKEVEDKLLPGMDLNKSTHEIETTILTSFKGTSKVQVSAIEKSLLAPLRVAADKSKIKILAISPLSWVIKSIISLEPSISVLQIGTNLYSSQHYIGVDQTNNFPVEEFKSIIETIKTLKGAEPSIQTIYLSSSQLVEENLKENLSDTLPIQQLASFKEDDSKMPSYVKHIIESSMRTLSITDFPVPKFKLGKATTEDKKIVAAGPRDKTKEVAADEEVEAPEIENEKSSESKSTKESAPTDLPTPSVVPAAAAASVAEIKEVTPMPKDTKDEETVTIEEPTKEELEEVKKESVEVDTETKVEEEKDLKEPENSSKEKETKLDQDDSVIVKEEAKTEEKKEIAIEETKKEDVNLSQFAGKDSGEETSKDADTESKIKTISTGSSDSPEIETKSKKVIKNSSGVNNMLKMVFITLAVFFITIAIGIGVGLGLLKVSDGNTGETNVVVVTQEESTPTPTPTPTPAPEEEIDKEAISILVVNATTKAGYAGEVKADLVADEIEDVDAGNAAGDYETGNFVLMEEESDALKAVLEEATGLDLEYAAGKDIEDPEGDYDTVIILAE